MRFTCSKSLTSNDLNVFCYGLFAFFCWCFILPHVSCQDFLTNVGLKDLKALLHQEDEGQINNSDLKKLFWKHKRSPPDIQTQTSSYNNALPATRESKHDLMWWERASLQFQGNVVHMFHLLLWLTLFGHLFWEYCLTVEAKLNSCLLFFIQNVIWNKTPHFFCEKLEYTFFF